MVRAAIYCRVSTDEQAENNSLASQIDRCQRLAEYHGFTIGYEPFLEDESGMLLERPELNKVRKLIRKRQIDVLIVHTSSRLTRQVVHGELLLDELFSYGVRLFIAESNREIHNTPDDRDFFIIENVFNRRWRNMLLEAMTRNKHHMIRSGKYLGLGLPPYGYDKVKDGKENKLVVNVTQAAIVQQIFDWYVVEGLSINEILRRLRGTQTPNEERGIVNLRGKGSWSPSMVRRLLHREAYCGTYYQHIQGDRIPMDVDPIIDRETWEAAQLKLAENSHLAKRNTKYDYLMGKRLSCGNCSMHASCTSPKSRGIQYFYYYCNSLSSQSAHPDCGMPFFPVHLVDNAVWEWIVELMKNPKALRASLKKAQQVTEKRDAEIYERIAQIDATWARQEERLLRLLEEYDASPGEHTKRILRNAKEQVEAILVDLNHEKETLLAQLSKTSISDEFIDSFYSYAKRMRGRLDNADFATKREIVESLPLYGTIALEGDVKVVWVHWHIYKFKLYIENTASSTRCR